MLHSHKLNNKTNRLHERCLRIIYNNNLSNVDKLLDLGNSISTHHRNLQNLATGLYKVLNGISHIMKDIFPLNTSSIYEIRNRETFYSRPVKSV